METRNIVAKKIRKIKAIGSMHSSEKPATVNDKLQKLKDLAGNSFYVCEKEVRFPNSTTRSQYCKQFKHNDDEFGCSKVEFKKATLKGAIFLVTSLKPPNILTFLNMPLRQKS